MDIIENEKSDDLDSNKGKFIEFFDSNKADIKFTVKDTGYGIPLDI